MMRNALVTGGQGFIGQYLLKALRRNGVNVKTLARRKDAQTTHIVLVELSWGSPALEDILVGAASD